MTTVKLNDRLCDFLVFFQFLVKFFHFRKLLKLRLNSWSHEINFIHKINTFHTKCFQLKRWRSWICTSSRIINFHFTLKCKLFVRHWRLKTHENRIFIEDLDEKRVTSGTLYFNRQMDRYLKIAINCFKIK